MQRPLDFIVFGQICELSKSLKSTFYTFTKPAFCCMRRVILCSVFLYKIFYFTFRHHWCDTCQN